jgi:ribosomal protein S10
MAIDKNVKDKKIIKDDSRCLRIKIIMKSPDHRLLDFLTTKIKDAAFAARIKISVVHLPTERTIFNCLRSPTIYKDSVDQFVSECKKRVVFLFDEMSFDVVKNLSIPAGVEVTIKTV